MVCTFFGHRDAPYEIEHILRETVENLIKNENVKLFYVGNNGRFDSITRKILKELKQKYDEINYYVVLAYMPGRQNSKNEDYADTIYPDGLENTPPRYAISKRNMWMIDRSDIVVTYTRGNAGGAAKFKETAQKRGRRIINLFEYV